MSGSTDGAESGLVDWACLVALAITLIVLALADTLDGTLFLGDVDDRLRAIQIDQLYSGKSWFDLTIDGIAMPEAYVSPWSRIVDAPYIAFAWLVSPLLDKASALQLAYIVWPPAMLLAFAGLNAITMSRLIGGTLKCEPLFFVVAGVAMAYAAFEFAPGRIDHHNVQLLALSATLAGLALGTRKGAVLAAVGVAVSLNVGLETLPLIAVFWAGVTLAWIFDAAGSARFYPAFSLSLAAGAPLFAVLAGGPKLLVTVENDVFSAPYMLLVCGFALFSGLLAIGLKERRSPALRFCVLAAVAVMLLGVVAIMMPSVLAGPYHMIDDISRQYWLEHVAQESTVLMKVREGDWGILAHLAFQGGVLFGVALLVLRKPRNGLAAFGVVVAVAFASYVLTLGTIRFIRFPAALVPLLIPVLLVMNRSNTSTRQTKNVISFVGAVVVLAGAFVVISRVMPVAREPGVLDAADFLTYDACTEEDYALLNAAPAGRYMAPAGMTLSMLEHVAPDHSISNITYHRASPGIRRMFQTFLLSDDSVRREALSPFDYVAFCAYPFPVAAPAGSLYEALLADDAWPGLVPLPLEGGERLRVFRIDHENLQ